MTDGGFLTTLMFEYGFDLPDLAPFILLKDEQGRAGLKRYYKTYVELALRHKVGFILESPTWRASSDLGNKLGYTSQQLDDANRSAIQLMEELRNECFPEAVVSCELGPRGDAYKIKVKMNVEEAEEYHQH